jgi:hypothetical protein
MLPSFSAPVRSGGCDERTVRAGSPAVGARRHPLRVTCDTAHSSVAEDMPEGGHVASSRELSVEEIVELVLNDQEFEQFRQAAEGIRAKCADLAELA